MQRLAGDRGFLLENSPEPLKPQDHRSGSLAATFADTTWPASAELLDQRWASDRGATIRLPPSDIWNFDRSASESLDVAGHVIRQRRSRGGLFSNL